MKRLQSRDLFPLGALVLIGLSCVTFVGWLGLVMVSWLLSA